jgi:hypothetical protein
MRFHSCALAATLLLGSSAAIAQNSAALRWTEGAPNATSDVKDNVKIEGLKTDDAHIFVSLTEIKETEYNRVWVQVYNHSKSPIDFDPQTAVLRNGDKTIKAEAPDKAANSIQKTGEAKSQELSSAHCNMLMTGQNIAPGAARCQPTDTQMQMSKQVLAFSGKQAQWVRDNSLKQGPIAPDAEVQGAIFFRKDKKPTDYIMRISVGNRVFEFPLSAQNHSPTYD